LHRIVRLVPPTKWIFSKQFSIVGQAGAPVNDNEKDKHVTEHMIPHQATEENIASNILSALVTAEKYGHDLECHLQDSSAHVAGMKVSQSAFWTVSLPL
jgi:hypothetical protein